MTSHSTANHAHTHNLNDDFFLHIVETDKIYVQKGSVIK